MQRIGTLAVIAAFFCTACVQAEPAMTRIELACADVAGSECVALQQALVARAPKTKVAIVADHGTLPLPGPDTLRVRLDILNRASDFVVARLAWGSASTAEVTGPEVELSVLDSTLSPQSSKDLARGLLQVSDLPI